MWVPSTVGMAERVSQLGRSPPPLPPQLSPRRRGIKKQVSPQAEQHGLSLMSCHPRAAVSSQPVAEQIKTVPPERGACRRGWL